MLTFEAAKAKAKNSLDKVQIPVKTNAGFVIASYPKGFSHEANRTLRMGGDGPSAIGHLANHG
jgi:hypothetical protein